MALRGKKARAGSSSPKGTARTARVPKKLSKKEQEKENEEAAAEEAKAAKASRIKDAKAVEAAKRRAEEESSKKFKEFRAFHDLGTRETFDFSFPHVSGFCVRVHSCHCPYCIRDYRPDGFWTAPLGCLMEEPVHYTICERTDKSWIEKKEQRIKQLSDDIIDQGIKEGDIIAVSNRDDSINKHPGASYNVKYPKSIFGGFFLLYVAQMNGDTLSFYLYDHKDNSCSYDIGRDKKRNDLGVVDLKGPRGMLLYKTTIAECKEVTYLPEDTTIPASITLHIPQIETVATLRFNGELKMLDVEEAADEVGIDTMEGEGEVGGGVEDEDDEGEGGVGEDDDDNNTGEGGGNMEENDSMQFFLRSSYL